MYAPGSGVLYVPVTEQCSAVLAADTLANVEVLQSAARAIEDIHTQCSAIGTQVRRAQHLLGHELATCRWLLPDSVAGCSLIVMRTRLRTSSRLVNLRTVTVCMQAPS